MWQSRLTGETHRNGSFKIQASDGGAQLVLEGSRPLQVSLPAFGAGGWGSMDVFFQGLKSSPRPNLPAEDPLPPAPVKELPGLPSSPTIPDVERSPDNSPIILAKPEKRQLPHVLPSENSWGKPAPAEQPAMINPKIWKCACGSENAGQFCPKCGSEKPTIVGDRSVPIQPIYCKQCGAMISNNASFCRSCGTKVSR